MESGLQVDLRVVKPSDFGSALQYFTGSKEHNIKLREIAKKQRLKISEYGIFKVGTNRRLGGEEEEEIYKVLGLTFIPAVLRENRGEIEAALEGKLPNLVTLEQVRGDLHVHSIYSDGSSRLEDLAEEALKLGYEYVAVCDHAERLKVARGMSPQDVKKRLVEIEKVNQVYQEKGLTVLNGVELNIENDGEVDYPAELLAQFDLVSASIHWGFGQNKDELTKRVLKAMENPYVNVICHPTGRIIGKREPYQLDFETIFRQAAATNTFLEINSFPDRLDLRDELIQEAKKVGCKFALGTDAHGAGQLSYMRYGVATAQRGWLEPQDVLNTFPLPQLLEALRKPT
jgi:DNA polymerase (family 10)